MDPQMQTRSVLELQEAYSITLHSMQNLAHTFYSRFFRLVPHSLQKFESTAKMFPHSHVYPDKTIADSLSFTSCSVVQLSFLVNSRPTLSSRPFFIPASSLSVC